MGRGPLLPDAAAGRAGERGLLEQSFGRMSNEDSIYQCGVCERWTGRGKHLPSGNRNPRTGETPSDNFVCDRCEQEAREMREALAAWERKQKAA